MKTSGVEVLCDRCRHPIPTGSADAIFVTLRGVRVGHVKWDLCGANCFERLAGAFVYPRGVGAALVAPRMEDAPHE